MRIFLREGGRERERKRILSSLHTQQEAPRFHNPRVETKSWMFNQLCHPGDPELFI